MAAELGSASAAITADGSGFSGAVDQAIKKARELDNVGANAFGGFDKSQAKIDALRSKADSFEAKWRGTGLAFGGVGLAIAGGFGFAANAAIGFEASMGNVNSIAQLSSTELSSLSSDVMALAQELGVSPTGLADGLYDIYSVGFQGADALNILSVSAQAAQAGLTDTAVATDAVTSVLAAYGLGAQDAQRVSDVLFQTVNDGKVTFDQLATQMGEVLPAANAMGVSIEELGAGYAVMTKSGFSASTAQTGLKAILTSVANPTEALTAAVNKYGYASAEAYVKAEGFPAFLQLLATESGGSTESMLALLGTTEATGAALALTKNGVQDYTSSLANMENASGATQRALAKQQETTAFAINRLKASVEALAITFGSMLTPYINMVARGLTGLINGFNGLSPSMQRIVAMALGAVGAFAGLTGGILLVVPVVMRAVATFKMIGEAIKGVGIAMKAAGAAMSLNPVVLIILAIIAVGALLYAAYKTNFLGFADGVNKVAGMVKDAFNDIKDAVEDVLDDLEPFIDLIQALSKVAKKFALEKISDAFQKVQSVVRPIVEYFRTAFSGGLFSGITNIFNDVSSALSGLADRFPSFGDTIDRVADQIGNFVGILTGLISAFQALMSGDWAGVFDGLKDSATSAIDALVNGFLIIPTLIMEAFQAIDWSALWSGIQNAAGQIVSKLGDLAGALLGWVTDAISGINWSALWDNIQDVTSTIIGKLGNLGSKVRAWVRDAISGVNWSALWDNIQDVTGAIVGKLGNLAKAIGTWVKDSVSGVNWSGLWENITDVTGAIVGKLGNLAKAIATWVRDSVTGINWSGLWSNITDVTGAIVGKLGNLAKAIGTWVRDAITGINWSGLWSNITDVTGDIVSKLGNLGSKVLSWARDAISGINWSSLFGNVSDVTGLIISKLGKLASKIKTWVTDAVPDDWSTFFSGVTDVSQFIVDKLGDLKGKIETWAQDAVDTATAILNKLPFVDIGGGGDEGGDAAPQNPWAGLAVSDPYQILQLASDAEAAQTRIESALNAVNTFITNYDFSGLATQIELGIQEALGGTSSSTLSLAITDWFTKASDTAGTWLAGGGWAATIVAGVATGIGVSMATGDGSQLALPITDWFTKASILAATWLAGGGWAVSIVAGTAAGIAVQMTSGDGSALALPMANWFTLASPLAGTWLAGGGWASAIVIGAAAGIAVATAGDTSLSTVLTTWLTTAFDTAAVGMGVILQKILAAINAVFVVAIPANIESGMSTAVSTVDAKFGEMDSIASRILSRMRDTARSRFDEMASAMQRGAEQGVRNVESALNRIPDIIDGVGGRAVDTARRVGANISDAMARGMESALDRIRSAANAMVDAAQRALDARAMIASPSKLFMERGGFIVSGFVRGITRNLGDITAAGERIVDRLAKSTDGKSWRDKPLLMGPRIIIGEPPTVPNPGTGTPEMEKVLQWVTRTIQNGRYSETAPVYVEVPVTEQNTNVFGLDTEHYGEILNSVERTKTLTGTIGGGRVGRTLSQGARPSIGRR